MKTTTTTTAVKANPVSAIRGPVRSDYDLNPVGLAATFVANAATFGDVKVAYLPLGMLYVNSDYQRPPQNKIRAIAEHFDENKCGFLLVNYDKSAGAFAIVDGQNRFLAAKMAGRECVPCQIMNLSGAKQEATVFAAQNKNRVTVSTYDKFRASLFAGDENAIRIMEICNRHNVKLSRTGYDVGKTKAVLRIIDAYKRSPECLEWVLTMLCDKTTWGGYSKALKSSWIQLFKALYDDTKQNPDFESGLIQIMKTVSPETLYAMARAAYPMGGGRQAVLMQFIRDVIDGSRTISVC